MNYRTYIVAGSLLSGIFLAGCSATTTIPVKTSYTAVTDGQYTVPAIASEKLPLHHRRQQVSYETTEKPGTIIVDTAEKYLYLVEPGGKAMRYGIGVGREGFQWRGTSSVAMKREWPTWTPPAPMIKRQPELAKYRNGMAPGLSNPLGARALYLYRGGRDSGYRIHGTPEWWSIGKNVSSGCIRMINQDVIDLYDRTGTGAKVIVK